MAWLAGNLDPYSGDNSQAHESHTLPVAALGGLPFSNGNNRNVFVVTGVPSNGVGNNGDYAFRLDGTAGATRFYQKAAGSWSAVAAVN